MDINVNVNLVITEVLSMLVLLLAVVLAICLARYMKGALILMSVRVVILIVSLVKIRDTHTLENCSENIAFF